MSPFLLTSIAATISSSKASLASLDVGTAQHSKRIQTQLVLPWNAAENRCSCTCSTNMISNHPSDVSITLPSNWKIPKIQEQNLDFNASGLKVGPQPRFRDLCFSYPIIPVTPHLIYALPSDGGFDAQTLQATCHLRDVEAATIVFVHGFEKTATIGDAHPPETKLAKKWRRRSEKWHLQIYITLNISPRVCASSWASHGKPEFILFDWVSLPSTFLTYQHPAFNFRYSDSDLICC